MRNNDTTVKDALRPSEISYLIQQKIDPAAQPSHQEGCACCFKPVAGIADLYSDDMIGKHRMFKASDDAVLRTEQLAQLGLSALTGKPPRP